MDMMKQIRAGSHQIQDGMGVVVAAADDVAVADGVPVLSVREEGLVKRIKIVENENHAHFLHKEDADMEISAISATNPYTSPASTGIAFFVHAVIVFACVLVSSPTWNFRIVTYHCIST